MKSAPRPKPSRSATAEPAPRGAPIWPAVVWAIAFAGCFAWYGFGTVPVPTETGADLRRGEALSWLSFPEVIVGEWFGDGTAVGFADRLPIVALAALFLVAAASVGRAFLAALAVADRLTRAETLAFSIAVGLNVLSLYTLLLGLAGATRHRLAIVAPYTLAAAFGIVWLVGAFRQARATPPDAPPAPTLDATSRYASVLFLTIAGVFALFLTLGSLIPPSEFDVREYHLQAPKEFYRAGRISFLPHNVYANMPLGAEMHALAATIACGDWKTGALVGKALIASYSLATALAVFALGARLSGRLVGALAAALYLSTPWVYQTATTGLIEGAFALYVVTGWHAVWLARAPEAATNAKSSLGFVALAGWCAGAAVACKYPALVFVVAPLFAWIAFAPARENDAGRNRLVAPGVFVVFVALAGGAWLAKNAAATRNPVYPLLYSVFDGATRTPEKDARWTAAHDPPNFSPVDLGARAIDFLGRSPWQSVLLAPLAALAVFSRNRAVRPLAIFLAVDLALWWALTHRVDRFWTPLLPIWAALAALGADAVWDRSPAWRWAIPSATLASVALMLPLVLVTGGSYNHNKYFVRLDRLWNDPHRFERWHKLLDDRTAPGEAILFVGDPEPFDLEARVLYNTVFDDVLFESTAKDKSPAEIHAELRRLGVTTVYVSWFWIERYREPGNYGYSPFPTRELFRSLMNAGVFDPPLAPPKDTTRIRDEAYPVRKTFGR